MLTRDEVEHRVRALLAQGEAREGQQQPHAHVRVTHVSVIDAQARVGYVHVSSIASTRAPAWLLLCARAKEHQVTVCDIPTTYPPTPSTLDPIHAYNGPPSLLTIHRFVTHLRATTSSSITSSSSTSSSSSSSSSTFPFTLCISYGSKDTAHHSSALLLVAAYRLLCLNEPLADIERGLFHSAHPTRSSNSDNAKRNHLVAFRDASAGASLYALTPVACLEALMLARQLGWYDVNTFNAAEFEYYEQPENGDLNVIVPGRFVAMAGPADDPTALRANGGARAMPPSDYVDVLQQYGVTRVVRLNEERYDEQPFRDAGMQCSALVFEDGGVPTHALVHRFLRLCEKEHASGGAVAVHCRAGLGRTGTLAACYLIRYHTWTAAQAIAWTRICRPFSIVGKQQTFVVEFAELEAQARGGECVC